MNEWLVNLREMAYCQALYRHYNKKIDIQNISVPVLPVWAEVREADLPLVDVQLPASRTAGTVIQYTTNIPSTAYSFYFVQFSSFGISY